MKQLLKIFRGLVIFLLLTAVTQVGGIVYLIWQTIIYFFTAKAKQNRLFRIGGFFLLYIIASLVIVPTIATQLGRVSLPITETNGVRPATILSCLLNRHYVYPELKAITFNTSNKLRTKIPDAEILYLDANFPFFDGFPLLPHWSHSDGKKLDLGFIYTNSDNQIINDLPTHFGYGSFEPAQPSEHNAAEECAKKGAFQYSFLKYFAWFPTNYRIDEKNTSLLVKLLHNQPEVQKIFIEPHLKTRWGLSNHSKVRFHGCHAVRHDDHIHFQIN